MEKCSVDGRILRPCDTLDRALEDNASRKGLAYFETVNLETLEPARSIAIAKSGEFVKQGIVLKFCPFCGTDIFSHWDGEDAHR